MPKTIELTETERLAIYIKREKEATLQALSQEYNTCIETVRKTVMKVEATETSKNRRRFGRPRITTKKEDWVIVGLVQENPHLSDQLNLNVAEEIIRNRLHEANLFGRTVRNKHINEINRRKSLEFAHKYIHFPKKLWRDVLGIDESRFKVQNEVIAKKQKIGKNLTPFSCKKLFK